MNRLGTVAAEVAGLFVDDGSFALAIVGWLLFVWLALPRFGVAAAWTGVILFVGLAGILMESAVRRARRG